jgi:predicted transcriptional regulator
MKKIVIGVMSQEKIRERALAIARGEYKPKPGEPRVWFTSMRSVAEVLSDSNRALLQVIIETAPASVADLAKTTGRKRSNLSRTLRTMSRYGLVALKREHRHVRPIAMASDFQINASTGWSAARGRTRSGKQLEAA